MFGGIKARHWYPNPSATMSSKSSIPWNPILHSFGNAPKKNKLGNLILTTLETGYLLGSLSA